MRLYEFLECFNSETKIHVLDEDGTILDENVIREIRQGVMNRRDVLKAYFQNGVLEVVTVYEQDWMDIEFANCIYMNLRDYKESNIHDLSSFDVEFEGKIYSVQEAIEMIMGIIKEYLRFMNEGCVDNEKIMLYKNFKFAIKLYIEIIPYLWKWLRGSVV